LQSEYDKLAHELDILGNKRSRAEFDVEAAKNAAKRLSPAMFESTEIMIDLLKSESTVWPVDQLVDDTASSARSSPTPNNKRPVASHPADSKKRLRM
jgi:hypothetical protein